MARRSVLSAVLGRVPGSAVEAAMSAPSPRGARLRVLFVDNAPFIGGAQVNMRHLLQRIDRATFAPELAVPRGQPEIVAFYADLRIPVHAIPMARLRGDWLRVMYSAATAARALRSVTRERAIDLLFVSAYRTGFLAAVNRLVTGVPFVWRLCDISPHYNAYVVPLARHVTCVSEAVRRSYPELLARRFEIVYSGVVAEDLDSATHLARRGQLRQEMGIDDDAPVVGCVANHQRWKGADVVYRAMRLVAAAVPGAQLVHIGGGVSGHERYAQELAALALDPVLRGRVHALGYREAAYRYYPVFDVVVHTPVIDPEDPAGRHTEAFGQPVAEGLGCGLPVVVSNVGGLPELVDNGVTGLLVPANDPDGTASAIVALLLDPARRVSMGREAKRAWRTRFTQEREVRDYERIFRACADRRQLVG